jgi:iron complex transport system substrate-binding protein
MGDLIRMAGGINVAGGAGSAWPQLGIEAIVAGDPEVILTSPHDSSRVSAELTRASMTEGWRQVTAIRRGAVHYIPLDLIGRPGPRLVDGLEAMARAIHPEWFPGAPTPGE